MVGALVIAAGCDCGGGVTADPPRPPQRDPEAHARCVAALGAVREVVDDVHEGARARLASGTGTTDELRTIGDACREIRVQLGLAETASRIAHPTAADVFDVAATEVRALPVESRERLEPLLGAARRACP
jgi:hypothetical protein